jgi:hypothetical protein
MGTEGNIGTGWEKFVGVLKDIPFWALLALGMAADILSFTPGIKAQLPKDISSWLLVSVVLFNTLAVVRAASLCMEAWRNHLARLAARRTFHLSPDEMQSFWAMARQRDDSTTTQLVVRFLAKNLTDAPLGLVNARLIHPTIRGEVIHSDVMVRGTNSNLYGSAAHSGHGVPGRSSLPGTASIMIRGTRKHPPQSALTVVIGITDDEGNEQRLKLSLRGTGVIPNEEKATAVPVEPVFSIADPIEKEVVSVLQAELGRYDKHGRERGGLGSVHIVYGGRVLSGIGTDAWNPDSPKNQSVVEDPQAAVLESDNMKALLARYQLLSNDKERERFAAALLGRIDAKGPYLRISYFIVCVLWQIGGFSEALVRVKTLPEEEIKVFGLSNVLLMLNGLLRYRHPDFTQEMLDQIESLVHCLKKEHTFTIAEKVAAIRAYRLLTSSSP